MLLVGGCVNIFYFHPYYLEKWSHLTSIFFKMGWLKLPPRFDEDVFPIEKWGYFQPVMSIFSMEKPPTSKWRDGMTLHHLPSFFGFPPKKVKLKVHGSHVRGAHGFFFGRGLHEGFGREWCLFKRKTQGITIGLWKTIGWFFYGKWWYMYR